MRLWDKIILVLLLFSVIVLVAYSIGPLSTTFVAHENRLKKYMLSVYEREFEVSSVVLWDNAFGTNNIHCYKGYFMDDPSYEVSVDMIGNQFSKYYWSEKESEAAECHYFDNMIDMYYENLGTQLKLKKAHLYQYFEPDMDFDSGLEYLKTNELDLNITGIFKIDCYGMTKYELENTARALFNDFIKENVYLDLILEGELGDIQDVKIHMLYQKWLPSTSNKVTFEYFTHE